MHQDLRSSIKLHRKKLPPASSGKIISVVSIILLIHLFTSIHNDLFAKQQTVTETFNVTDNQFGAVPNDNKDDVPGIQKAIDSAKRWLEKKPASAVAKIYFPAGTYLIKSYTRNPRGYWTNYALRFFGQMAFSGSKDKPAIIKLADHMFDSLNTKDPCANANIFYGNGVSNSSFNDLTIDMNGINNLVPRKQICDTVKNEIAIKIDGGKNVLFENITIKNSPGRNHIAINGDGNGLKVLHCRFINGGWNVGSPTIANSNNTDFSFLYSEWDNSLFQYDTIVQEYPDIALQWYTGGIEVHGSNSHVLNVVIHGCIPGVYIASEKASRSKFLYDNTSVQETIMTQCVKGIEFFIDNPVSNCVIKNNYIQITYPRGSKLARNPSLYKPCGIRVPNGNMPCYQDYISTKQGNANKNGLLGLVIRGNTITADIPEEAKGFSTVGMMLHSLSNSTVDSNHISGMNYAGIQLQGSAWGMKDVLICKNIIDSFGISYEKNAVAAFILVTDTYTPNSDCEKKVKTFEKITIRDNVFVSGTTDQKLSLECGNKNRNNACFRGMFFALPQWYGFKNKQQPLTLHPAVFNVTNNKFENNSAKLGLYNVIQPCGKPCP